MFLQTEEFDSWGGLEETFSDYCDSSSPDGTKSSVASKGDIVFMSMEKSKKKRIQQSPDTSDSRAFPIEIIELKVSYVGEKITLVSLKCKKRRDMMVKICEVFESLKLNVVTANITAFPKTLFKTLFIQVDDSIDDIGEIPILLEWNHEFQFYWNGKTNSNSVGITDVNA
ncbi:unnamed protein product [Lactuca saligna]|uniref:Plant bHLH transcription factor ACT-like domain-containing protein n=1 Tax=Lactuca saligna TaxID=75948 RepID=A0AA35VTD6_LACSI|nr:unnamed protein product [Lactuca saligna]